MVAGRYKERAMTKPERRYWNCLPLMDLIQKMESGSLPIVIRDGIIWGCEMDRRELEQADRDARSFPGLLPPNGAHYIGRRKKYLYWKDSAGNYWYDTERGMEFKKLMVQVQRKNKKGIRVQPDAKG